MSALPAKPFTVIAQAHPGKEAELLAVLVGLRYSA